MTEEQTQRQDDQDPQPVKESDAERVSGEQSEESQRDSATNPPEAPVRDINGS